MIDLDNVCLEYNGNPILENITLHIDKPGLYLIYGESGCGKTSLLNIIGLMEYSFKGTYFLDGEDVFGMSEKEKERARFEKITYLFQTPKLIENESIITNLELVMGRKLKPSQIKSYLHRIDMKNGKKKVSSLSGGEKQRVNILMGLLRNTPVIIGDEITSGLDEKNKESIMKILKEESKTKIVILVSHDVEFVGKYTKITRKIESHHMEELSTLKKEIIWDKKKKNDLSYGYLFTHSLNVIFSRKIRTLVSVFSSVIALSCLGLCLLLTTSVSDSVLSALGNSINDRQIIMEQKEENYLVNENISIEKRDIERIYTRYSKDIDYVGSSYTTDIDMLFQDQNYFSMVYHSKYKNLRGYSVNSIRDFSYIEKEDTEDFYLVKERSEIQEEDIILSFSQAEVLNLCNEFGLTYENEKSLIPFFASSPVNVKLYLENTSWDYNLETDFYVAGYCISDEKKIYHTDSNWNEYVIEEVMQLPYSLAISETDEIPWKVKKQFYFYVKEENISSLLSNMLEDKEINDYVVSAFKKEYGYGVSFSYAHSNYLNVSDINEIRMNNSYLKRYIPCTDEGYTCVKEMLISGFANSTFLSADYEALEEYIDMNSYSEYNFGSYQSTLFSYTSDELIPLGVLDATRSSYCNLVVDDSECENVNEIAISRGLARKLGIGENDASPGKTIYLLTLKKIDYANDKYLNNFEIVRLKVVSVKESEDIAIYCSYLWPVTFSMINLEKNNFGINKAIFDYEGNDIAGDIELLNARYENYNFSNPYLEYKNKMNEISSYIVKGLGIFSFFCLFSTLLMMITSSSLFVSESKKEIGIYTTLGYSRKSILKEFKIFSYFLSSYSFIISSFALFLMSKMLQKGIDGISFSIHAFSLEPYFIMMAVSFIIGLVSSRVSTVIVFKEKPLNQLRM